MALQIKEADWKIFRELYGIALARFCRRVIEEIRSTTDACDPDGYHDCYLKVYDLIKKRDKQLGRIFDDLRRSNAFFLLASIKEAGLLTDDDLTPFSAETREAIRMIEGIRDR